MAQHELNPTSDAVSRAISALGLEEMMPPITYTSWALLKNEGYNTRTNWKYDHRLVVKKGEKASAAYVEQKVYSPEEWYTAKQELDNHKKALENHPDRLERIDDFMRRLQFTQLGRGKIAVTKKWIPLFHLSQMRPGSFRERTDATIEFAKVFWRSSNRTSFIKRNFDPQYNARWFTKGNENQECELVPAQFFGEWMFLDHLRQRHVYGVKADPDKRQWWGAIDLDLHVEKGGKPEIFLKQAEAILRHVHGQYWRICLGMDRVNGLHLIKFFDEPMRLDQVHEYLQKVLNEVSLENPDLEGEAVAVGMTPIKQAEIYPSATRGFRLPLGIGYTALLDKPLSLVKYGRHHDVDLLGADVVSFINWNGAEMSLEEKLTYIRDRLPTGVATSLSMKAKTALTHASSKKVDSVAGMEGKDLKALGHMKGRFREVLVEFYSGQMQKTKSLQVGILMGIDALWAINYPLEERADYLLGLLQGIEVTNPDFSSRLNCGAWDEIRAEIERGIEAREKLRASTEASEEVIKSNNILKNWAKAMEKAGFNFSDRSTWDKCWDGSRHRNKYIFTPTHHEIELITQRVAPVFVCATEVAVEVIIKVVQLTAIKARGGHGMDREYRRALLTDFGISCRENSKLARCWEIVEECGFITCTNKGVFTPGCPGKGRANIYAVGKRVADRVYDVRPEDQIEIPAWLAETLADIGAPLPWAGSKYIRRAEPDKMAA